MLRTGRSRSVALHTASRRRSYGSIPHGSSPHRSRLPRLYPTAFSGARAPACSRLEACVHPKPATSRRPGPGAKSSPRSGTGVSPVCCYSVEPPCRNSRARRPCHYKGRAPFWLRLKPHCVLALNSVSRQSASVSWTSAYVRLRRDEVGQAQRNPAFAPTKKFRMLCPLRAPESAVAAFALPAHSKMVRSKLMLAAAAGPARKGIAGFQNPENGMATGQTILPRFPAETISSCLRD